MVGKRGLVEGKMDEQKHECTQPEPDGPWVNMVVKRGVNEASVLPMADHFRGSGQILRFIEYMDVGTTTAGRSIGL